MQFKCNQCGEEFPTQGQIPDLENVQFNGYSCPYCGSPNIETKCNDKKSKAEKYFYENFIQTFDFVDTEEEILERYKEQLKKEELYYRNNEIPPEEPLEDYLVDWRTDEVEINDNIVTIRIELKTGQYNLFSESVEIKEENREFYIEFDEDEEIINMDWD